MSNKRDIGSMSFKKLDIELHEPKCKIQIFGQKIMTQNSILHKIKINYKRVKLNVLINAS